MTKTITLPDTSVVGDVIMAINTGPDQWIINGKPTMAMGESEQQRMRSFVERYVCARASHFDPANEEAEAWECSLRARSLYDKINGLSNKYIPKPEEATQAPPSHPYGGVRGMTGAPGPVGPRGPRATNVVRNALCKAPHPSLQPMKDHIEDAMRHGAPPSIIHRMIQDYNDKVADYLHKTANPPIVDSKGWTG